MHGYINKTNIIAIFVVITLIFIGSGAGCAYLTKDSVTATVNKTETKLTGSGDSRTEKYMVLTDKESFENTDSIWYWKFISSDFHGNIIEGCTYEFGVYGFRIPFFSMYRNVISYDLQSGPAKCNPSS